MAHRNSYENEELHHLYEIIDRLDNSVFKYGISCKPIDADGSSSRMREQVNHLAEVKEYNPFMASLKDIFVNATPRPIHPAYPQMSLAMQSGLSAALANQMEVQAALDSIAQQLTDIIG